MKDGVYHRDSGRHGDNGAMGRLRRIWLKRARRGVMDPVPRARLVAGRGLAGNANQGGFRQVTIIDAARWADAEAAVGPVDPSARRANLLIAGIDLEKSRGRVLRVGPCRLEIRGETRPCERMDAARPGLRAALAPRWGGGAFAVVLDDGEIAVDDVVDWERPA